MMRNGRNKPTTLMLPRWCDGEDVACPRSVEKRHPTIYHRWRRLDCIRTDGDTDCGGLGMVRP